MSSSVRRFIHSPRVSRAAQAAPGVRELASRYFAGESIQDAVTVAAGLRRKGLAVSFNYLASDSQELATAEHLGQLLAALGPAAAGVELSVKPSTIGLRSDPVSAHRRLSELCQQAADVAAQVTLEMQRPEEYQANLELYRSVRQQYPMLGITIPVNLRRATADLHELAAEAARVRLCVGSYAAGKETGYVGEHEKSKALVRGMRILLESNAYPMIASHDPRIITIVQELARRNHREPSDFEFQLLYGVRPLEQRRLIDIGLQCRTYIPFGPAWYEYLATRIAARPRTLWSYARAFLDKR